MKHLKLISFCLIAVIYFSGCKSKDNNDPFAASGFDPYDATLNKRIEAYQDASLPNSANSKTGTPALYIDFSSGINSALKDPAIKGLIDGCYNQLSGNGIVCLYKLGGHKVDKVDCTNKSISDDFYNAGTYGDNFAPIEAAVDSIVKNNNDALLITDFEEYQNNQEELTKAFLKPYFVEWLKKGNTIRFYISDYKESKVNKHIYFTIFNCGNPNESSMLTKLESKLQTLPHYDLSNKTYKLETKYFNEKAGGIFYGNPPKIEDNKKYLDLKDSYINGLNKGNHFEFYPLGVDWKTINDTRNAYKSQNQFNDFFRNLFIDLSNEDAYTYGDFGVKVSDVTDDFIYFAKCNEAKNHTPKTEKGSNGEDKFSEKGNEGIPIGCYNPNGTIKDEWDYKKNKDKFKPVPLSEVFTLNKELFNHNKIDNNKKVELGVAFDKNFNLKNILNQGGVMRVDIVLNSAEPNSTNPILEKFKWTNSKNILNVALLESIKTTLQEVGVKPSNKVIYSYYIKTLQ